MKTNKHYYHPVILYVLILPIIFCTDSSITKPEDDNNYFSAIINIHTGIIHGTFDMTIGANCGPLSKEWNADYTSTFNELGIKIIRTHDYYGPCDWYTIFPDWELSADDPSSYNFASSDNVINCIKSRGFDVFFRLGPSWNDPVHQYHNDPPGTMRDNQGNIIHAADQEDFNKFAVICKNIVRHYNDGWAAGHFYNIKRWEIWNEPSVSVHFWSGTAQQFFDMFITVFSTLKNYDQTLIVGGPGLAGHSVGAYESGLIEYCKNNNINLDFFSWHNYGSKGGEGGNVVQSPSILGQRADIVRDNLNSYNFSNVDSICSEWNADLGGRNFTDSGRGAAFFGGTLTLMEEKDISENYLYRGDNHPLGIMKNNGDLKTGAYTLKAWKSLTENTSRISVTDNDLEEFYVIASKSKGNSTIWILLSNFSTTDHNIKIMVHQLDTEKRVQWNKTDWEISDFRKFERLSGPERITHSDGLITLEISIIKESVRLIKLVGLGGQPHP